MGAADRVRVELGRDLLSATLVVRPDRGAAPVTIEEIEGALAAAGVVHGIDPAAVKAAAAAPAGHRTIVAKGTPPAPGVDGSITVRARPGGAGQPRALPDGRVDHRDLQIVPNVVRGQVLAEKKPAIPGTPGLDVCGRPIAAPTPTDPDFPAGANTAVSPDGLRLVALRNGHLVTRSLGAGRHEIAVDETFTLDRSVDMTTGNLDCIGGCTVRGRVNEGFTVAANGNIVIAGAAEGSEYTSREGSVTFQQGLKGQGKAVVRAKKDVHARFIENATIEAEGDIIVSEHVYHSTLRAGGNIRIEGRPGTIMGGTISFVGRLSCRELGAPAGSRTRVYLGDWMAREARARIAEIDEVLGEMGAQMEQMRRALLEIRRLTLEDEEANREAIATLAKSAEGFPRLRERHAALSAERDAMAARIIPRDARPVAEVAGMLHPGVTLSGEDVADEMTTRQEKRSVRVELVPGEAGVPRIALRSLLG